MKKAFEILGTVATWTDAATGKKHKRTVAVGAIYESTHGKLVMRLDAIPVSRDWSGWLRLMPCFPELPPGRRASPGMPPAPQEQDGEIQEDEDMPF